MGGKGGPLAFLNKKPWHPLNLRNQEEIWKREQAYLAELEKRDQLVKQIEEEREQEDNVTQFQRHKYEHLVSRSRYNCDHCTACSAALMPSMVALRTYCHGSAELQAW